MGALRIRRGLAGLAVLTALLPLAACGDDEDPGPSASEATTPTASSSAAPDTFPVTITQTAGDVTIPAAPTRVVALDFPSADAAIALGVVPVGMAELTYIEGGVQEWTQDALGTDAPELFNQDNGFPLEKIAQLDPDVILATNTYPLVTENWRPLNAIAPVVAHVQAAGLDTWQDGMRKIALALGRTGRGEQLIDETEQAIARVREQHPEFDRATASFFNYVPGDGLYVINTNDDVSMRFLRELGFAGAPPTVTALTGAGSGGTGRAIVSPERYTVLEADVILGTTSGPDLTAIDELVESELFARVPAVDRGSFLGFGIGPATAMAFPSVLSVRWALDQLIDDLADAVRLSEDATTPTSVR